MQNLGRNRAIWMGWLLLGVSAWGNLHPPFIMPAALVGALVSSGIGIWVSHRRNTGPLGKVSALPGFAISATFLAIVALTPVLDTATKYHMKIAGITRSYRVRVPSSYDAARPTAVLIVFHGYNQTSYTIERLSRLDEVAERDGFLIVYPNGFKRAWRTRTLQQGAVNDVAFTEQMIADLRTNYTIDSTQIFALGFSNGGSLALSLGCALNETLSGIVAVGASLRDHHINRCKSEDQQPIPAMFINGTADRFVAWERTRQSTRRWAQLLHCELAATIDTLPDNADDGTRVWRERYSNCPGGAEAVLYAVEGAGHTWPNGGYQPRLYFGRTTRDFDSGTAISEFLHRVAHHEGRV